MIADLKHYFSVHLNNSTDSYYDSFNFEISDFLSSESSLINSFFQSFKNKKEVEYWVDSVKSFIVIHEHEDEVDVILDDFILLQIDGKLNKSAN